MLHRSMLCTHNTLILLGHAEQEGAVKSVGEHNELQFSFTRAKLQTCFSLPDN